MTEKFDEKYYMASQTQLIFRRLVRHKMAIISFVVLGFLYLGAILASFIAPVGLDDFNASYIYAPPTRIHFFHEGQFIGPHVYRFTIERDQFDRRVFVPNTERPVAIRFFVRGGSTYRLFGLFESDLRLFGAVDLVEGEYGENPPLVLLYGADSLGRCVFSRILIGSQVSLTVPLLGAAIAFILATVIGGISGYYGGVIDTVIQRVIEVLQSFPSLPLWMALSAAIPPGISVVHVFILITIIISLISWPGLARVVRGRFLSLKEEDFVMAAKLANVSDATIIRKHLIPGFMSYLIVSLTLAVPGMILGETTMSFLGLGMRAPATSWGVLLQESQNIVNISNHPWLLIPLAYVGLTVIAFNFLGDGLRDAADPYK